MDSLILTLDPRNPDEFGDGLLMNQGYTIAWSGWDISATPGGDRLTITVPVAKNPDGSSITGPAYEYIVSGGASYALNYTAATLEAWARDVERIVSGKAAKVVPMRARAR